MSDLRLSPTAMRGTERKPLTVDAITRHIKGLLEATFSPVWVEGEISQVRQASSGHVYLTLTHGKASLDAMIWAGDARLMRYQPGPGARVLASGSIDVYPPRGTYTLVIRRLLPAGEGARQAALEALTAKLAAEGLFDAERKRRLPVLPTAVGVVTSATGAARRDIEAVVHRRSPQIPILLAPAQVQGDGAVASIVRALQRVVQDPRVQVVIVGRGGGSVDDLWAFNEEPVVRAIAACPVPVISAVGHETDTTLADRVADQRAPTPSAAAELAVPVRSALRLELAGLTERLDRALDRRLAEGAHALSAHRRRLERAVDTRDRRHALAAARAALAAALQRHIHQQRARLRRLEARLTALHPAARAAEGRRRLEALRARLVAAGDRPALRARRRLDGARGALRPPAAVGEGRHRLAHLSARLEALSPLAVLARGYALVRSESGALVKDAAAVAPGQTVAVRLARGAITATVQATHPEPQESK